MKPLFRLSIHGKPERELDEELAFHLEMRTRELIAQGFSPEAARAEAERRFGNLAAARADIRRTDLRRSQRLMRSETLSELRQDLAFAFRSLARSPAYTVLAALTLALGIGANTAIFSVVRGILLRPLPFADPGRLVFLGATYDGGKPIPYVSPANLADWQAQNRSLSSLATLESHGAVLTGAGEPERLRGFDVSADFFPMLGVRPLAGRLGFSAEEAGFPAAKVVILNETVWRTRFGGDPGLVGRSVTLDNEPHLVVGIAPAEQSWPSNTQLWFPFSMDPAQLAGSRAAIFLNGVGRLKPGVTLAEAQTDFGAITARLARDFPDANTGLGVKLIPLHQWITGDLTRPLAILLGGVGFVLLIACANVANLALVRGAARQGELAVRTALGAGRGRLVRQLVTESGVLAGLGLAGGLGLAALGTKLLVQAAPASIPRLSAIHLDGLVLGFTLAVAAVTTLVFGLLPARLVVRPDLARTLKESGRGGQRPSGNRARRLLVVAEVALAVMLLAGAGLLIRSFGRLMRVDPGFRSEGTLSFGLSLPDAKYLRGGGGERQTVFMQQLMERLRALPGVQASGAALGMPLTSFSFNFSLVVAGRPPVKPNEEPSAEVRVATPGYLAAMGIPIRRGRGFTEADRPGGQRVLLLSESAAQKFFPNEDPLGKHVRFGWGRGPDRHLEGDIVGVVGDVKVLSLTEGVRPQFWAVYDQWPVASFSVVLHGGREAESLVADARRTVHELDPDLALSQVKTLETVVAESVAQPRFYMLLLGSFAGVAILLSAIGIYGVIAYLAEQRVREIGIRLALGASRGRVMRMIVREGALLTVAGVGLGVLGALGLSRVLEALLFEVKGSDPITYLAVTLVLGVVALIASGLPALKAAEVDPVLAMRAE